MIPLEDVGVRPTQAVVDLGFRGVDADNPGVEILHRGRWKSIARQQHRWVNRRQAIEPTIGHLKADHRVDRCWLHGATGDALHAVLCAAGFNLRWLLRAIVRRGISALFLRLWAWWCGGGIRAKNALRRWLAPIGSRYRGSVDLAYSHAGYAAVAG